MCGYQFSKLSQNHCAIELIKQGTKGKKIIKSANYKYKVDVLAYIIKLKLYQEVSKFRHSFSQS